MKRVIGLQKCGRPSGTNGQVVKRTRFLKGLMLTSMKTLNSRTSTIGVRNDVKVVLHSHIGRLEEGISMK